MKEVWIIKGIRGSYEDTVTWIERACATEELANTIVEQLKEDYASGIKTYQRIEGLIEPLLNEMYDQFDAVDWESLDREQIIDQIESEYSEKIFKVSGYTLAEFDSMKQEYDYDDEPFYTIEKVSITYEL